MPSFLRCSISLVVASIVAGAVNMGEAAASTSVRITNICPYTVWACVASGGSAAAAMDSPGIFQLAPGQSLAVPVPSVWYGRLWGRTDCSGSGASCHDYTAATAVTIAELSFNSTSGMDFYAISLVNGFNLPMLVEPPLRQAGSSASCMPTACVIDVDSECPPELRVSSTVAAGAALACQSACHAFGTPQLCCVGAYGSPSTCKPSSFSEILKRACPHAISYPFDTVESVFACRSGESITVSFCPPASMSSAPGKDQPTTPYNGKDGGTTEEGSKDSRVAHTVAILALVTAVVGLVAAVLAFLKKFL